MSPLSHALLSSPFPFSPQPEGGVAMGETFAGIVLPQRDQRPPEGPAPKLKTDHIPTGAWRDGCCDCCTNTPVCCMSCWCGPGK